MGFTVDGFNRAKSQMLDDFNKALTAAEELHKNDDPAPGPASLPEKSGGAGASLTDATPTTVGGLGDQAGKSK